MRGVDAAAYDADRVTRLALAKADVREALRRQVEGLGQHFAVDRDLPRTGLALAKVDRLFDVAPAEGLFGMEAIVSAAANTGIRGVSGSAERASMDVIDLEKVARRTPVAVVVDEGALFAVAFEDFPPGRPGHVTPLGVTRLLWTPRLAETLLFEAGNENVERLLENDGEIAPRVSMPHELGGALDFVAKLAARGQLELVCCLTKRLDAAYRGPRGSRAGLVLARSLCV